MTRFRGSGPRSPGGARKDALVGALVLTLALPLGGCRESPEDRRLWGEAQALQRQKATLGELIEATRAKTLVSPDWIAAAVDEAAVEEILGAGLPQEALLAGRLRVVVEAAEVTFEGGTSLVTLRARVADERRSDRRVAVVIQGGLGDFTISAEGQLETRVLVDHVEVPELAAAGAVEAPFLRTVVDELASRNREPLQNLMPPLSLPVRFEESLAFAGRSEGPVQTGAGELPVAARVARVLPLHGRLWVFLEVKVGPWRPLRAPGERR